MSKKIDTALLRIFVLIIANFRLLCLISLSTLVANFLITLRKEFNNGYFSSSISGGPPGYNGLKKPKGHDRHIVYNLSESKGTEFASMGIFVLTIVNFILLWLFPLSTIVANVLITLRQKHNNGHPGGSYTGGSPGH